MLENKRDFLDTAHLLGNLRTRALSSGVITGASQFIQLIITMVSTMVLARLIAPEAFGLVAMVMSVLDLLRVFKDAGLSLATVQREGLTAAQVSNLFWLNTLVSGAVTFILAVASPLIAWFFREPALVNISLVLSSSFLLSGLAVQHLALLKRQMNFAALARIQVGSLLVASFVGIGMAWMGGGFWSLVCMHLSQAAMTVVLAWSAVRWWPARPMRNSGTRPLVRFGASVSLSSLIWSFAKGSDGLLIGRIYGAEAVGLFSRAAALLLRPLNQCLAPVNDVFVPVLSRLQSQPDRYRRTFLLAYEGIALGGFLGTGLMLALATPITLVVLGPAWEGAAAVFAGFTVMTLFIPLQSTASWLFSSQARGGDWLRTAIFMSCLTLAGVLAGLPFGPAGVAVAVSLSGLFLQLPVVFWIAGRNGPVATKDLWLGFLRHLPVWVVVCGSAALMRQLVADSSPLVQLALCSPVGLAAGILFILLYPPSRRAAFSLWVTLRQWKATS